MLSLLFVLVVVVTLALLYFGTGQNNKILLVSAVWLVVVSALAYSDFFKNTTTIPPRFLIVLLGAITLAIVLLRMIKQASVNQKVLLSIHVLRLPVELVLYELYLQKQVPVLMTFKGWNYDILFGISAICILVYCLLSKRQLSKAFMLCWNVAGIISLAIIVGIAILSSPLPIQQLAFNQPNIAVMAFPFVLLPAFVVPVVLLSHLLMIKNCKTVAE